MSIPTVNQAGIPESVRQMVARWLVEIPGKDRFTMTRHQLVELVREIIVLKDQRDKLLVALEAMLSSPKRGDEPSEGAVEMGRAAVAYVKG